ncbi:hypothetical protein QRD43_15885 [Pelomonas sp. APW6]|uniref:Uncharacterized protein n=1 Tax=Roseateles subflavus TaxID=3053353 RepID=A0ABT7LKK5_9BURK|nr:hypothetical protein [Pelomonas sp. APW6]MDL5033395.1 hypothetical protein [Pelomonas sp. APW6]
MSAPSIDVPPADEFVRLGQAALAFGVEASGSALSYQWELSRDGGGSFTPLAGATSGVLHLPDVSGTQANATHVRVIVRNDAGQAISRPARITRLSQPVPHHGLPLSVQSASTHLWINDTTRVVMHGTGDIQLESPLTDHWEVVRSAKVDTPNIAGDMHLTKGGGAVLGFLRGHSSRPALLLVSDDLGKSWRQVRMPVANPHSVQVFTSGDVLLVSEDRTAQLWRTHVSRFVWARLPEPADGTATAQRSEAVTWAHDPQSDRAWLLSDETSASGTAGLVLRSTDDHGVSWVRQSLPALLATAARAPGESHRLLSTPRRELLLSRMASSPTEVRTSYWISRDQGKSWEDRTSGLLPPVLANEALIDPDFCGDTLLADPMRQALSTDGGTHWTRMAAELNLVGCTPGGVLSASRASGGRVRMHTSADGGQSWAPLIPPEHPWSKAPVVNGRGGFLAMDVDRQLFLADGQSFKVIKLPDPANPTPPLNLPDWQNPTFFAGNGQGIMALYRDKRWFVSQSAGGTWTEQVANVDVDCLPQTFAVLENGRFFCFTTPTAMALNMAWSDDLGKTWHLGNQLQSFSPAAFITPDFSDGRHGTSLIFPDPRSAPLPLLTRNGGESWQLASVPPGVRRFVGMVWSNAETLDAVDTEGQRLRSVDGGQSWTVLNSVPCTTGKASFAMSLAQLKRLNDNVLLMACGASGETRFLASKDGGAWQQIGEAWPSEGVGLTVLNGQAWAVQPQGDVHLLHLPVFP